MTEKDRKTERQQDEGRVKIISNPIDRHAHIIIEINRLTSNKLNFK